MLTTTQNSPATAQADSVKPQMASYELLSLLYRIHPPVIVQESVDSMSNKDRKNKKEKSHASRQEQAALKPTDHPSNQNRGRGFNINPDRLYETGESSCVLNAESWFFV